MRTNVGAHRRAARREAHGRDVPPSVELSSEDRVTLTRQLRAALGRFGVAGEVCVTAEVVRLSLGVRVVDVQLGATGRDWAELNDDQRERRVNDLARRLAQARGSGSPDHGSSALALWLKFAAACGALLLGVVALRSLTASQAGEAAASAREQHTRDATALEAEQQQRVVATCDAARSRVLRGATLGPTDVEGWIVELAWYGGRPVDVASLTEFLAFDDTAGDDTAGDPSTRHARLVDPSAGVLRQIEGPGTEVRVRHLAQVETPAGSLHGARLEFTQRYVLPYFQRSQRIAYVRLAHRLAEHFDAEMAGLYARCAHAAPHYAGAWFYGPNPGRAAAALVYWMGSYTDQPYLPLRDDSTAGRQTLLGRLLPATDHLSKLELRELLSAHGGMVAGRDGERLSLRFEFSDSNRASRASRAIAGGLSWDTPPPARSEPHSPN